MMIKEKLRIAINRSQLAYESYASDKLYYQALRIYNANTEVYTLLNNFVFEESSVEKSEIFNYMFHLEDWFAQFENTVEKNQPELEAVFVFDRLKNSVPFPKNFYNLLNNQP